MVAILDFCNISPESECGPNDIEVEAVEVSKKAKPSACIRITG